MNGFVILESGLSNRIFGLDPQLLFDALVQILAVGFLFFFLTYILWNPARDLIRRRREKIKNEMDTAKADMEKASTMKAEYETKLKEAGKDVDKILEEGRKKAIARENQIVAEANEEAKRIRDRAEKDIELEKSKARDDLNQEVISVAGAIAGKFVKSELDANAQAALIDSAISEMGENTWQN